MLVKNKLTFRYFFNRSFIVHVVLFILAIKFSHLIVPEINTEKMQLEAQQFEQAAYKEAMKTKAQDMQEMKRVLENLQTMALSENVVDESLAENLPEDMPETITEMYEFSEQLLNDFSVLEDEVLKKKLAELDASSEPTSSDNSPKNQGVDSDNETLSEASMLDKIEQNNQRTKGIIDKLQQDNENKSSGYKSQLNQGNSNAYSAVKEYQEKLENKNEIESKSKARLQDYTQQMKNYYGSGESVDNVKSILLVSREEKPESAPPIYYGGRYLNARKLHEVGELHTWIALNTWYIVGPFENTGRKNLHRAFAPEQTIDLDAKYLGKQNKIIQWQYRTFSKMPMVPLELDEYEIYYGYTEVETDIARDVWLAVGSDDQSKVWLNDLLIWDSVPQHKGWSINEGYRKVHLKSGKNTILFRLENGQHSGAFSLFISTKQS